MDRQRLEELTFEQLQTEAASYGLRAFENWDKCIDAIMTHLERHGPLQDLCGVDNAPVSPVLDGLEGSQPVDSSHVNVSVSSDFHSSSSEGSLLQLCTNLIEQCRIQQTTEQSRQQEFMAEQSRQQRAMLQQMFTSTNTRVSINESNSGQTSPMEELRTVHTSASKAHAVNLLSTHIPEFNGSEEEDVELWIHTIERVAQIHQVSNDILLLAATGKLKNTARRWLDLNISVLIESWPTFKQDIVRRFKREVLFHVVYQKTEARRWNFPRESFQDYAMDKLAILRCLKLPDTNVIQLLINGIGSKSLRETAAVLRMKPLEEFIEEVHKISIASRDLYKRSPSMPIKNQSG